MSLIQSTLTSDDDNVQPITLRESKSLSNLSELIVDAPKSFGRHISDLSSAQTLLITKKIRKEFSSTDIYDKKRFERFVK